MIEQINGKFSKFFSSMQCVGEVDLHMENEVWLIFRIIFIFSCIMFCSCIARENNKSCGDVLF